MFKAFGKAVNTCVKTVPKTRLSHNPKTLRFSNPRFVHQFVDMFYGWFSTPQLSVEGLLYTKSTGSIIKNYLNKEEY